ncbi:helix-turn-helix domain-containing protein [Lutibacter sp. B2]|nr:helix-turn-helix domain-containing protein [Lutibacter sp. B2]
MNNMNVKVNVKPEDVNVLDLKELEPFNHLHHLQMLHGSSDGWITLALKINETYTQYHYKYKDLKSQVKDTVENFDINTHANIYISQNTFYKPQRRIENIKQLRALYVDIDCYKTKYSKDAVLYFLQNDFNDKLPRPNLILDTGRGLNIIWLIEPVPYKALPLWTVIEKYFCAQIKEFGSDSCATDPTRILRIAESRNMKSNTTVKILDYFHHKYSLREIQEEYLPELKPKAKKSSSTAHKIISLYNQYTLYHARIMDIVKLCELRKYKIKKYHMRELILFLYRHWLCCFTNDPKDAYEKTKELNQKFDIPLKEREMKTDTKSAEKGYYNHKVYNYKNTTLLELLEITETEQKHLKTLIGTKEKNERRNEHRKGERRKEHNELTEKQNEMKSKVKKAKKLYKKGYTQEEISQMMDKNQSTISRYING